MITDGKINLIKEDSETTFELSSTMDIGSLIARLEDDVLTVYQITDNIKNNPKEPDTLRLVAVGYSKDWEHHVWMEL